VIADDQVEIRGGHRSAIFSQPLPQSVKDRAQLGTEPPGTLHFSNDPIP
jgi:hypothetical protein